MEGALVERAGQRGECRCWVSYEMFGRAMNVRQEAGTGLTFALLVSSQRCPNSGRWVLRNRLLNGNHPQILLTSNMVLSHDRRRCLLPLRRRGLGRVALDGGYRSLLFWCKATS